MSDTISKLKDLKELLDGGALTQDEFDAQKAVLLGNSKITQVAPAPVVGQPRVQSMRGIPADWLAGSWTRPGDGCCLPTINGTVTPIGESAFQFSAPRLRDWRKRRGRQKWIYTRDGGASGGDTWTAREFKLTVLDENTFSIIRPAGGGHVIDLFFTKDTKTSHRAKPVITQQPDAMAGA